MIDSFEINRRFGVELEFDGTRINGETLGKMLSPVRPNLLAANEPLGPDNENWIIKPDETCGWELCSPPMPARSDSMDVLALVISLLNFEKMSKEWTTPVTKKCSLHLHLEITDLSPRELFRFIQTSYRIEGGISSLLPPSRRRSEYAIPLRKIFKGYPKNMCALGQMVQNRNIAVNISNYLDRGTVEIRYAAGTTNPNKINFWVILWSSILERSIRNDPPDKNLDTLDEVLDWLRWAPADRESEHLLPQARFYLSNRVATLKGRTRRSLRKEMEEEEKREGEL